MIAAVSAKFSINGEWVYLFSEDSFERVSVANLVSKDEVFDNIFCKEE